MKKIFLQTGAWLGPPHEPCKDQSQEKDGVSGRINGRCASEALENYSGIIGVGLQLRGIDIVSDSLGSHHD